MNALWHFDSDEPALVIHTPTPPRPWANCLTNGIHGAIVTQTGGGFSFFEDCQHGRLTRWAPANYLTDHPGRWVYVLDEESGELWSLGHQPVGRSDRFEARHGLCETRILTSCSGIAGEVTFAILTPKGRREEWLVRLENEGSTARSLRVFPCVVWQLGDHFVDLSLANLTALMNRGRFDDATQTIQVNREPWANCPWPYRAFFSTSLPVMGWQIDQETLLGPAGAWARPSEIVNCHLSSPIHVMGIPMVGCFEHHLALRPGESREFTVAMGEGNDMTALAPEEFHRLLDQLRHDTRKRLITDCFRIETPCAELDPIVNIWIKRQIVVCNHWGRSASLYHEGGGELGYRNTAQDAWGILPIDPAFSRERLIALCRHQRAIGQPLPGWSPLIGPSRHEPPSDFPVWLPLLALDLVKETGDASVLDQRVPFDDDGDATVYEHLVRALDFLHARARSPRGLPLMGTQDWNDAFDRVGAGGRGESVWLAMAQCFALRRLEELATWRGDNEIAQQCWERWSEISDVVNAVAWDGEWYVIAFDDDGRPVGSRECEEGRIHLNAQTWAILAGIADEERTRSLLRVIDEELDTPLGPVLHTPPHTHHDPAIGRITAFASGTKENAALFTHAGAFKIWADLLLGRGAKAWKTFHALLPHGPHRDPAIYRTEPHVFAEYTIGPGNPRHGEGAFTWLTGSADWLLRALLDRMLGVEPDFEGLRIHPCLPPDWQHARVRRPWRGAVYDVEIINSAGVETGLRSLTVDGKRLERCLIPEFGDGCTHTVTVEMGRGERERVEATAH